MRDFPVCTQPVCLHGAQRFGWLVAKPGAVLAGRQRGAPPAKPPRRQLALLCPMKREVVKPGCLFQRLGVSRDLLLALADSVFPRGNSMEILLWGNLCQDGEVRGIFFHYKNTYI